MNKVIYEDKVIEYAIDRKKRKNLYICVELGKVLVKSPMYFSDEKIKEFVYQKRKWIYEKLLVSQINIKKEKGYINGETFEVLGKTYILEIIYDTLLRPAIGRLDSRLIVYLPLKYKSNYDEKHVENIIRKLIDNYYIAIAKKEVDEVMRDLVKKTSLIPNSYRIKKLNRSWGICSSKKNISINVNLVARSKEEIEYVVLHELCHLKHMNHSKKFWNLVMSYMPEYKIAILKLKNRNTVA